jgi:hypothetical protein
LQVSIAHRDRVPVVGIIRLTLECERGADAQTGDRVLTALEGNADDLGMKRDGVGNPRVGVAQVLGALGKGSLDERVARVLGLDRRRRRGTGR